MGRKNVVKSFDMVVSGDMSGNITSSTTDVINLDKASIYISWSGSSPVGTLTVEATNSDPVDSNSVWRELDFGSAISVSGNTGDHDLIFTELPFRAIRLVYTFSSGTGTLDATISAKTTGA